MATTPMQVVTKDLLTQAFLEELSAPTPKAEELIEELKAWSECNPNPDDPEARTMRDVFDELIQDPDIIAALQGLKTEKPAGLMDTRAWTRLFFNADSTPARQSDVRMQGFEVNNEDLWPTHLYAGPTALKILKFWEYERGGDPLWLGLERSSDNMIRVTQDGEYAFTGTFRANVAAHYTDDEVVSMSWPTSPAAPVLLDRFQALDDNTQLAFRSVNFTLSAFVFRKGNAAGPQEIQFRPVVAEENPTEEDLQYPYHTANEGASPFTYARAQARKHMAFHFSQRLYLKTGDEIYFRLQRSQPILSYGDRTDSLQFAKITDAFAANPSRDTTNFIQITRLSDPPPEVIPPAPSVGSLLTSFNIVLTPNVFNPTTMTFNYVVQGFTPDNPYVSLGILVADNGNNQNHTNPYTVFRAPVQVTADAQGIARLTLALPFEQSLRTRKSYKTIVFYNDVELDSFSVSHYLD